MKTIKPLIALFSIFILLPFNGCKKDDSVYDVYCWTSVPESESGYKLTLFVDDEEKGIVPYFTILKRSFNPILCSNKIDLPFVRSYNPLLKAWEAHSSTDESTTYGLGSRFDPVGSTAYGLGSRFDPVESIT